MVVRRRDVALSVAAALAAWALSVSWIPSLRLTPYAFLCGAVAGLGLAVYSLYLGARHQKQGSALESFAPVTSLGLSSQTWAAETAALKERRYYTKPAFKSIPQPLDRSLDLLLHLILRDFVKSWYTRISTGQSFPNEVDRTVRLALDSIADKLQTLDLVQLCVTRLVPILDYHLEKFVEAEHAVRGKEFEKGAKDASEEDDIAIATKFDHGRLHPAASLSGSNSDSLQQDHLRNVVAKLLHKVLPETLLASSSVSTLIREIVSCAVLLPAMQLFTDPDFLNQHIEGYGRAVLQERKTVKKLRAALDEAASIKAPDAFEEFPHLSPNDSEKTFEQFIRAIRLCSVLHEARRIQGELARQVEHEKSIANQDITFLRRLEIGKRLLDQRIEQLSDYAVKTASTQRVQGLKNVKKPAVSLRDILYDSSGLAYLMEFMDRSEKTIYVQFWIVVDGLRNPSERIFDNNIEEQPTWGEAERQIINKINNNYLWRPELNIPPGSEAAVVEFLDAGNEATLRQYNAARRAILTAQAQVFQEMDSLYFSAFKASDLYAKSGFPMDEATVAHDLSLPEPSRNLAGFPKSAALKAEAKSQTNLLTASTLKSTDLRRAIASSTDLHSDSRKAEIGNAPRRSLDDNSHRLQSRKPLFEAGDDDTDPLSRSIGSIDSDLESPLEMSGPSTPPVVNAVHAALEDMIDENGDRESLFEKHSISSSQDPGSERGSMDIKRPLFQPERPTLSSLGLLGTPSKRTVFNSDDLFGENEQLWEEENNDVSAEQQNDEEDIKKAAPGDLGLAEMVQSLSIEINKLEAQQSIVKSLLSKAELTNNVAELRILRKSQASLTREIRRKELQRQQYIIQENDNTLYGKASVSIKNIMVGTEPDGHEFALYVIEVSRTAGNDKGSTEQQSAAAWAIARRYSEFHDLHRRLRRRFQAVREIEFPRRQMVLTLQKEFLKRRQTALERYLRELLKSPEICRSRELRAFLSQQSIKPLQPDGNGERIDRKDFVTRIYNSVSDGMEEFLGNVPIIDQLSAAGQNLIAAATTVPLSPTTLGPGEAELADPNAFIPASIANDPATAAEARRELTALESESVDRPGPAPTRKETTFIAPIASAFLTLFQLRTSTASAWLRGRAVIIVLQQLLGGTVERRVRDTFNAVTVPAQLSNYLDQIREAVWPGGRPMGAKTVRTRKEKERSRSEAGVVLAAVLIDVAGGVIGRSVAREAGRRLGRMIGNERILKGLGYRILDELVEAVWDIKV